MNRSLAEEASEDTLEFVLVTSAGAHLAAPQTRLTWAAHTDMVTTVEVVEGGDGTLVVLTASYDKTARVRARAMREQGPKGFGTALERAPNPQTFAAGLWPSERATILQR